MSGFIWDISYDEKRSQLKVKVMHGKQGDFIYTYHEIPYVIYFRTSSLYKKSIDEFEPGKLHGVIWNILRHYQFEKEEMKKKGEGQMMKYKSADEALKAMGLNDTPVIKDVFFFCPVCGGKTESSICGDEIKCLSCDWYCSAYEQCGMMTCICCTIKYI